MFQTDPVRRFLLERGCPDELLAAGLAGLVSEWERIVAEVEAGYPLGLDDYLNDLDDRQLLDEALQLADPEDSALMSGRIIGADERMRRCTKLVEECLWGERVAEAEGWTPEANWWYFSVPRSPGPQLREDLKDE